MALLKKKSSTLTIIAICILVLMISGGILTIYLTYTISSDAEVINKLGIIRGSIQRFVMLELTGEERDDLIEDIEAKISEFNDSNTRLYEVNKDIHISVEDLYETWNPLKRSIVEFRERPTIENERSVVQYSEEIWRKSNHMVLTSQIVSENKVEKYNASFILFGLNLVLGILIILLIQKYVKNTLEHLVHYDVLTSIYNRRYFNDHLEKEIYKSERYNNYLALIIFDIDHFKSINDAFGHDVGDCVLRDLSHLVQSNIRKCDVLARIGGEEFAIIAPQISIDQAFKLSEKIRVVVENNQFQNIGRPITISLGITQFAKGDNSNSIYKRADNALYKAKNKGRNRSEIEMN